MNAECEECLTERAYNHGREMAGGCRHGTCIRRLLLALSRGWRWALRLTGSNLSVLVRALKGLGSERSQLGYEAAEERKQQKMQRDVDEEGGYKGGYIYNRPF